MTPIGCFEAETDLVRSDHGIASPPQPPVLPTSSSHLPRPNRHRRGIPHSVRPQALHAHHTHSTLRRIRTRLFTIFQLTLSPTLPSPATPTRHLPPLLYATVRATRTVAPAGWRLPDVGPCCAQFSPPVGPESPVRWGRIAGEGRAGHLKSERETRDRGGSGTRQDGRWRGWRTGR